MMFMLAVEAADQTVSQRVVPFETQGRVFELAMMFEAAAALITTFIIAPLAEFWIIPYMDSEPGQQCGGWLLGDGDACGIVLVFLVFGIASILLALGALCTMSYRWLSIEYVAGPDSVLVSEDLQSEIATDIEVFGFPQNELSDDVLGRNSAGGPFAD